MTKKPEKILKRPQLIRQVAQRKYDLKTKMKQKGLIQHHNSLEVYLWHYSDFTIPRLKAEIETIAELEKSLF